MTSAAPTARAYLSVPGTIGMFVYGFHGSTRVESRPAPTLHSGVQRGEQLMSKAMVFIWLSVRRPWASVSSLSYGPGWADGQHIVRSVKRNSSRHDGSPSHSPAPRAHWYWTIAVIRVARGLTPHALGDLNEQAQAMSNLPENRHQRPEGYIRSIVGTRFA